MKQPSICKTLTKPHDNLESRRTAQLALFGAIAGAAYQLAADFVDRSARPSFAKTATAAATSSGLSLFFSPTVEGVINDLLE